jgi:hypothetical protein
MNDNSLTRVLSLKKAMSIPKQKRMLSDVKVDNYAGPTSYNVTGKFNYKKAGSMGRRAVIGTEQRNFDPTKYSTNQ